MDTHLPDPKVLAIRGSIQLSDIGPLCERARTILAAGGGTVLVVDLGEVWPDAVTVDAMARLRLTARRLDCGVRFANAGGQLKDLVRFVGLQEFEVFDFVNGIDSQVELE